MNTIFGKMLIGHTSGIVALGRTALASALVLGFAQDAEAGTLKVVNNLSELVTVNVDGQYACSADANSSCTSPQTDANHSLQASTASGKSYSADANIGPEGYTWTIP